jgi:hypothetical protein
VFSRAALKDFSLPETVAAVQVKLAAKLVSVRRIEIQAFICTYHFYQLLSSARQKGTAY